MAPRDTWTDERLDDFRAETKREFTAVRTEMRNGFAQVDRKFEEIDKRFDRVDKRFDRIDARFEQVNARFEKVNEEFVAVRKEVKEGFDKLNRTLLWFCGSLLVAVIASLFTLTGSLLIH